MKIARHAYGYANLVRIRNPEPAPLKSEDQRRDGEGVYEEFITVSLPRTSWDESPNSPPPAIDALIPREGLQACRAFLAHALPSLADRPFTHARLCWYTDTRHGDWIVDHHPRYEGLFVATGGSGHAYKFLPVLGDVVVDCILGRRPRNFDEKWRFPAQRAREDHVWTEDWRGGVKGLVLDEELAKGRKAARL